MIVSMLIHVEGEHFLPIYLNSKGGHRNFCRLYSSLRNERNDVMYFIFLHVGCIYFFIIAIFIKVQTTAGLKTSTVII